MPSSRRLRLSPEAEDDLRDILQNTLDRWGREQQDRYEAARTSAFQALLRFPSLGRDVGGSRAGARRYRVEQHAIFYEADDDEVRVARILHVRMDTTEQGHG